jgi:hypothetical protein
LPQGFPVEIMRLGDGDTVCGAEILPDPTWNTLSRGYMLYRGAVLKLKKGSHGLMELDSFQPPDVNIATLTHNEPNRTDLTEISAYGQREVILAPAVRHTFRSHSGIAIGDTVTLRYNALTTIAHVPGVIETFNGRDFVATESGTLLATRDGEVLRILDPTPHAWMESQGIPAGTPWSSDADGDGQSLLMEYAFGGSPEGRDGSPLIQQFKNGSFRVSFLQNIAATDLIYRVEASSDLKAWDTILTSGQGGAWSGSAKFLQDEASTEMAWITVTDVVKAPSRFLRVRVDQQ